MTTVNTTLGSVYVDDRGEPDEPTALLWPSLFTDHRMWRHQIAPLREAGWRTLALDPPGHGRSPGEYQRGDAAGRPGADHHRIETRAHRASTTASDRVQDRAQAPGGSIALPPFPHGGTDSPSPSLWPAPIYLCPEQ